MSNLTQIAGMFIGKPDIIREDLERVRGVKSTLGNIVHITHSKSDEILDVVTAKRIIDNVHFKSLKTGEETFDFEVIGEHTYDEHLVKGNRVIIPGENTGEFVEFVIERVVDRRSSMKSIEVFSYASFIELDRAKVIEPFTLKGTAEEHLSKALAGTEHVMGAVESNRNITISFDNHTDPYEYIRRIANEFDLEPNFRVLHNGLMVTSRVVDLVDKIGAFRGREFTFGKDLDEIKRTEEGSIYTALIGLSPEDEDGNRKEVFVEDLDALNIWGRPGADGKLKHMIGVYEPESERDDMTLAQLRQYTQTELNKRKSSVIKYEMTAIDLENIVGHQEKATRFGDVIRAKDTLFEPPLYVEARIFEMRRNVITPMQKDYTFGDFVEFDADAIHDIYKKIKKEVNLQTYSKKVIDEKDLVIKNEADSYTDKEIKDLKEGGEFARLIISDKGSNYTTGIRPGSYNIREYKGSGFLDKVSLSPNKFTLTDEGEVISVSKNSGDLGFSINISDSADYSSSQSGERFNKTKDTSISSAFGVLEVGGWTYSSHTSGALYEMVTNVSSDINDVGKNEKSLNVFINQVKNPSSNSSNLFIKDIIKVSFSPIKKRVFPGIVASHFEIKIPNETFNFTGIPINFTVLKNDGSIQLVSEYMDVVLRPVYRQGEHLQEYWSMEVVNMNEVINKGTIINVNASFNIHALHKVETTNINPEKKTLDVLYNRKLVIWESNEYKDGL